MEQRLRPTLIKKTNKAGQLAGPEYDDDYRNLLLRSSEEMDSSKMDQLIISINQLGSDDHMRIYVLLRQAGQDKNFFSRSKKATHFDLSRLPNDLKWRLAAYVQLSQLNRSRQQVIDGAAHQHQEKLDYLNDRLNSGKPLDSIGGDSETDRYEKMLKLNDALKQTK